ncbi:cytochrome P450, partial [Aureobasidium melanogenum]
LDSKKFGSPRSGWYGAAIDPNPFHEPNVTTLTDMGCHEHRRKILSPAYNDFDVMESLRYSAENHLGKVLDDHIDRADQGVAEVDLAQIAERFSIQAFSNMVFGQNLAESDVRVISRTVSRGQLGFMMMTMFPWIRICVGGLSALLKLDQYLAFGKTLAAVKKTATDRLAGSTCASSATNLNATQIADNLNVQMIASCAVTAPAIAHLCGRFLLQPETTQNYVKRELAGGFTSSLKRKDFQWFSALRDESLRLCPPALHFREKLTPPGGYPEYKVPGGTLIGICLGAAMRDLEVFGANPDEYDPSRWMTSRRLGDTQSESLANMTNVLELNFGSGISKCLGQKVALLELAVFLSKLTEYEWEPTKDPGEFGVVVKRGVLRIENMPVKVQRRSIGSSLSTNLIESRSTKGWSGKA